MEEVKIKTANLLEREEERIRKYKIIIFGMVTGNKEVNLVQVMKIFNALEIETNKYNIDNIIKTRRDEGPIIVKHSSSLLTSLLSKKKNQTKIDEFKQE